MTPEQRYQKADEIAAAYPFAPSDIARMLELAGDDERYVKAVLDGAAVIGLGNPVLFLERILTP